MSKFKTGDKVRVIANNYCGNDIGSILIVGKKPSTSYNDTSYDGSICVYFEGTNAYNCEQELELIERKRKEYSVGDTVVFNVKGKELKHRVYEDYLSNLVSFQNDEIFHLLKIKDKYKFASDIYGYKTYGGEFPEYHNCDMIACNKIINALLDLCDDYEDNVVRIKKVDIKYTNLF